MQQKNMCTPAVMVGTRSAVQMNNTVAHTALGGCFFGLYRKVTEQVRLPLLQLKLAIILTIIPLTRIARSPLQILPKGIFSSYSNKSQCASIDREGGNLPSPSPGFLPESRLMS